MQRYGIPASITLAQGLLESGAGTSLLAVKANNHFGIKTGGTWTGPYFVKDDDAPNERFRVYRNAQESYEDHSLFLKNRSRYASLFTLAPTDYKGWARGLKAAGYATNPEYANKLISIIEIYKLHQYDVSPSANVDKNKAPATHHKKHKDVSEASSSVEAKYVVRRCNGVDYVVAQRGDDWESLSRKVGESAKKLRKYNEMPEDVAVTEGSIIFLKKKRSHADDSVRGRYHVVMSGESIHSISQRYAVTLKSIYRANDLDDDYYPNVGDRLILP